jgi:hypothetical protein
MKLQQESMANPKDLTVHKSTGETATTEEMARINKLQERSRL